MLFDTIAAIATSSKNGSISVIRVSGEDSLKCVGSIFRSRSGKLDLTDVPTHTIHYGFICDNEKEIDEVLVLVMRAPRSYTAESVVEIQCHGGYFICQQIMRLLVNNGVRVAEPGEFTKRAFLNGRLDLSQAESVMDLIQSKSQAALENSLSHLKGRVREKIVDLREFMLEDIAYLEAALDDPEHISLENFPERMREHTVFLKEELHHLLKNCDNGRVLKEGVQTVILGKPNVGKSSFLNCILRENRAIVTDIPGTTRDTLEEEMMIGDTLLRLIDTAGIHETEDKVESIGIGKAMDVLKKADFALCILDASGELTEEDLFILDQAREIPGVILLNKSDLKVCDFTDELEAYPNKKRMAFSARTGQGLKELEDYLNEIFIQNRIDYEKDIYITNLRQREALAEAVESVDRLVESIENNMPEDFYSIDLYAAYEALGKIIGETVGEDIIEKIFKDFCMGK